MKKLSREEMKMVMGGQAPACPMGSSSCVTNSDCGAYQSCQGVPGCCATTTGDKCTSNSTCGNGQSCVDSGYGFKWCNVNP